MDFLNKIKNNSILILPGNLKNKVLDYINDNNLIINVKLLSFNDLKKGLLFDYTNETINYVMKKYNVNYGVSKDYINNLYYIEDKPYSNKKLKFLSDLKIELTQNNLLIFDSLFLELIKSKDNLYVYGFDYINKFNKHLLDKIKDLINIEILDKKINNYNHDVYEFETLEDEVAYVFESINKLIDKGVALNKIFITNYSDEYYFTFKRLERDFNLPIYIKSETSLYSTAIGTYLIDNLNSNLDLLIYKLKKQFDYDNNSTNANIINKITNVLNNYYWSNNILDVKDLLIEELKRTKVSTNHFEKEITTTNIIDNSFSDDEYVFLIGFNLGSIPKLKRDEDYISDDIKPDFVENTNEYNKVIKDTYLSAIKNIKNITITYKLSSAFNTYSPSFLVNDESFNVITLDNFISEFSDTYNKLSLTKRIDNLIKFNETSEQLDILFNNYNIDYKSYDNKFKGISNQSLLSEIDDKINFSYSNITDYYSCPFKFYLRRIIKLNKYEDTLDQFIGSLFHFVLENTLEDKMTIDDAYNKFIEDNKHKIDNTNKASYFLDTLKEEIHFVVDAIKEQYKHSSHDKTMYEEKIEIDVNRKIKTTIKGFVDKILVLNNYLLVVDYKTNNKNIDKDLFEFGIGIQLPIYLYLLKQIDSNYEVAGLYLQHILDLKQDYNPDKDYLEEKKKKLKLQGITFDNINLISKFDDSYENSEVISALSMKADGTFKKAKHLLSEEDRNDLITLMENLIINCIDKVSDGKFDISPIKIDSKADGCEFCEYKDICFRKFKDFNLQVIKSSGGDENE